VAIRPDAYLDQGWVCMPYHGNDLARVEIQAGANPPVAAFLDWVNGERVAKVRPHTLGQVAGTTTVTLRVDGIPTATGRVTI
jgi:hypothetical protein